MEDKTPDDFIKYIFSDNPKPRNYIKLELDQPPYGIHISMHIFYELFQIFMDGLFYLKSDNDILNINNMSLDDIELMKKYFLSFGFTIKLDIFEQNTYQIKQPNLLFNKEYITKDTKINEYFYEIIDMNNDNIINKTFRISFDYI